MDIYLAEITWVISLGIRDFIADHLRPPSVDCSLMSNGKIQAIELIEAVLRGELSDPREFTRRVEILPTFTEHSDVAVLLHQAQHYVTDADVFSKDPAYQKMQTKNLVELVNRLKNK